MQLSDLLQLRVPGVSLLRGLSVKPTAEPCDIKDKIEDSGAGRKVSPPDTDTRGKILCGEVVCSLIGVMFMVTAMCVHGSGSKIK